MRVSIRVKSRSKKRAIIEQADGSYLVHTNKARENGQANADVVDILSKHFSVPKSSITIKSGHGSARKIIEIVA